MIRYSYLNLELFPLLSTRSRRAICRVRTKGGRPYDYRPRITLIRRLAHETGMSEYEVMEKLREERKRILASYNP